MNLPSVRGRLQPVFSSSSVAIVGASERARYAAALLQNLFRFNFPKEKIFPVNPRYQRIFDLPCYPSVAEIPFEVDLAVIAIPRDRILPALHECVTKRVRSVLILSAGFGEFDDKGRRLEQEINQIAEQHSILVCGPNTLGLVYTPTGLALWSTHLPNYLRPGPVGAVFNSSGILYTVLNIAAERRIGIRYAIGSGNGTVLDLADYLRWLVSDDEVNVVLTLIESVKKPQELRDVLDLARERRKPIIALHAGRSVKGGRAVASHTGNMATSGAAWEALFRQKGVISVDNVDQMIEAAALFAFNPLPNRAVRSKSIVFVTNSGGDCSYISDICDRLNLNLADLPADLSVRLPAYFGGEKHKSNPFDVEDLHASEEEKFYDCLRAAITEVPADLVCCRLHFPKVPDEWVKRIYTRVATVAKEARKGIVFIARASEHLDQDWFEFSSQLKVPLLLEYEKGLRAVRNLLDFACSEKTSSADTMDLRIPRGRALDPLSDPHGGAGGSLYQKAREILLSYGVRFPEEILVVSFAEALSAARSIGFPVALKVVSPDLDHKTEVGGVYLNVADEEELRRAFSRVETRVKEKVPAAKIEGIVVQKMVPDGIELILGATRDPQLGPVIMFGLGGIYAEIIRDVSLRVAPVTEGDAWAMIGEIKGSQILSGARGRPKADLHSVVATLLAISQLAEDFRDKIETVELNPLLVLPAGRGAVAVDFLVKWSS